MATSPGPRLFGLTANRAPVVAVLRRGPSHWSHVSRWDIDTGVVQPGAWLRGTIAPQKCDLSPDGRWFAYTAVKYPGDWEGGAVYQAVSKLPWLTALAAWNVGTTYTRGMHFVYDPGRSAVGHPDLGSVEPLLRTLGVEPTPVYQFAVERRRGWTEAPGTPHRTEGGPWDGHRDVEMVKSGPGGEPTLHVQGSHAGFRSSPSFHDPALYHLQWPNRQAVLDDVQWADWSDDGRLLVATVDGRLQIREVSRHASRIDFEHDMSLLAPDPTPPPEAARRW